MLYPDFPPVGGGVMVGNMCGSIFLIAWASMSIAIYDEYPEYYNVIENIKKYQENDKKVIVCLLDNQYDTYKNYLDDFDVSYEEIDANQIPKKGLGLTKFKLLEGFELVEENIIYFNGNCSYWHVI